MGVGRWGSGQRLWRAQGPPLGKFCGQAFRRQSKRMLYLLAQTSLN